MFTDLTACPIACHLEVTPNTAATAYADGRVERDFWIDFSAARRTHSPNLSEEENILLFGQANSPMGHGHNYRLRATLAGEVKPEDGHITPSGWCADILQRLKLMLDHRNLNVEVPELADSPITTECLARFAFEQLQTHLPVARVRLYEMADFFAEYDAAKTFRLGYELPLHAAHRLHCDKLTREENRRLYGKCNNPAGHGHRYRVEATVGGLFDERSGTLFDLGELQSGLSRSLAPWQYKHLDIEVADFRNKPSTGENISHILWPVVGRQLQNRLVCLRIWETPNNRFTLRA